MKKYTTKDVREHNAKYDFPLDEWASYMEAEAEIKAKNSENKSLQAKLDSLMFEFCPEDMTTEQIAEYERNQVIAKGGSGSE